jgi:hypothetical protein
MTTAHAVRATLLEGRFTAAPSRSSASVTIQAA